MGKIKLFLISILLSVNFMLVAFGDNNNQGENQQGTIGAPLDGGLLALLAAGGVSYYLARKHKKDK